MKHTLLSTMEKIYIYATTAENYPADGTILHWELWDTPADHISIPAILQEKLLQIRTEHARWAYDMAFTSVSGQTVESWLQCGESLSQWWCSLLYERHPKMTPSLYPVYKLRALELWLAEQNVHELHLVGELPDRNMLTQELKSFVQNVYVINPKAEFNRAPITEIKNLPYDLLTHFMGN